jgi:hypothetical protein
MKSDERCSKWPAFLLAICGCASMSIETLAQPAGIETRAREILKRSTDFVAAQKSFRVEARSTIEAVLTSGQRLQFDSVATLSMQRPNRLLAERRGDLIDQVFHYDGASLTLSNPREGYFASVTAPQTIEAMLDFAREKLDVVAPAGDLLCANAYDILMQDVTSAFVVGKSVVEGVRCDHLAFRSDHTDWQIWIQEGAQPLPRKLVITSKDVAGMPQFSVVTTKWDLRPKFKEGAFTFTPPRGGGKTVDFLPVAR